MEQLETNNIAQKLESLDMLPEGYTPNLDSKWALLERSLEGERKAKRKGFIWMRAAATILICSLVVIFLPDREPELNVVKTNPVKKIEQALIFPEQEFRPTSLKYTRAATRITEKKEATELQSVQAGQQEQVLTQTALNNDSSIYTQPSEELGTETTTTRKKKTRYVQMDFGDTDRETKVAPSYCTPTRFKLFNSGQQNQEKESQTNSGTSHLRINL